jgi:DNA-binding XRE family transcriptional regulator
MAYLPRAVKFRFAYPMLFCHKKGVQKGEQKEIGKRIKYIRLFVLEKSQKELGETLGVNQSIISRIETGRTSPSLATLLALSRLSGRSVDWIMKGE